MKTTIFFFILILIATTGCNDIKLNHTDIEVERGKIYEANVTDSSNPPIVAVMTKGSNIYRFNSRVNYPIIVKNGWIDVDGDKNKTTADLINDLNLTSYSNIVTPITSYLGDTNSIKGKAKLDQLISEMNVTKDNLLKVPSQSTPEVVLIANTIFLAIKRDGKKIVNIEFTDINDTFDSLRDMLDTHKDKTIEQLALAIEQDIIKDNNIPTISEADLNNTNQSQDVNNSNSNNNQSGDVNSSNSNDNNQSQDVNNSNSNNNQSQDVNNSNSNECNCSDCNLTVIQDDSSFQDNFPSADIEWSSSSDTVKAIEDTFNYARSKDSTISKKLILPTQAKWDSMTNQQKGLFLLNRERYDRGIKPFEGINNDVIDVAQQYANLLYTKGKFDHKEDETSHIRLERKDEIKNNKDFWQFAENLYVGATSSEYIKNPIIRAVYGWIYDDKDSNWGHRKFCLATGLNDNSGKNGEEGLIGFGVKTGENYQFNNYSGMKSTIVVMNAFDPGANWNHANTKKVSICTESNSTSTTTETDTNSRFKVDNEKGVIIDNETDLMWQNNQLAHLSKDAAVQQCESLNYNSFSDWRLPSSAESGVFHLETNKAGITPNQKFSGCTAEITTDGYIKTKKGAERYGGEPGSSISFGGSANIRCVRS